LSKATEFEQLIQKYALQNAVKHNGRAEVGPVIGKILAERSDLKSKAKEITQRAAKIVKEVNTLSLSEQKNLLKEKWPELLFEEKVKPEERVLPPLPNVKKYKEIVTRFSPNPDCVLHIGNARAIILSHDYARMYKGKFYLRFEDTDPKTKKPEPEFYESIREDLSWLECKWNSEFRQSERLPIYYEYTKKLLQNNHAYICTCNREKFKKLIMAGKPCPCRNLPPEEQLARWEKMLDRTYFEGKAVVRVKTDLSHPNPAVRDWPALRIIDTKRYPHPIVGSKYRVWPLYNLACGLDDHLMGITHIIRGKEHLTNEVRQRYMYKYFNWSYPETIHYGRLKVTGAILSKSKIKLGVDEGFFAGYDDPRLATFKALRRRGIVPQAIRKMIIEIGPKTTDTIISWENLYAHNRKILDPSSNRYFFVSTPIKLIVEKVYKPYKTTILLHPDYKQRGSRSFTVKPINNTASFHVSSNDIKLFKKGKIIRLMELFNVKINKVEKQEVKATFHSEPYSEAKKIGAPLIHWIPVGEGVKAEVIMPNTSIVKGIAEDDCKKLREGTIIQFERFGFVRINQQKERLIAYYAHI